MILLSELVNYKHGTYYRLGDRVFFSGDKSPSYFTLVEGTLKKEEPALDVFGNVKENQFWFSAQVMGWVRSIR